MDHRIKCTKKGESELKEMVINRDPVNLHLLDIFRDQQGNYWRVADWQGPPENRTFSIQPIGGATATPKDRTRIDKYKR